MLIYNLISLIFLYFNDNDVVKVSSYWTTEHEDWS